MKGKMIEKIMDIPLLATWFITIVLLTIVGLFLLLNWLLKWMLGIFGL